jgi:hypothetical protein
MTTLILRRIKDHLVLTGPDIEPMQFKTRPEARDWCRSHYPGSPITEIGRDRSRRAIAAPKGRPQKAE